MGYDLDEIPTRDLHKELERRKRLLAEGKCPYCGQPIETHTCKMKDRIVEVYTL